MASTEETPPGSLEEQPAMTTVEGDGPALVLGPMLRYVSETEATIWVETDRQCQVEILGRVAPTFAVAGHHYGLVVIDGLAPGSEYEYQVALDGGPRWPLPDSGFPPSVLRTLSPDRPTRIAFGSCRVAEIALSNVGNDAARQRAEQGSCALAAEAAMLRDTSRDRWPDVLLMIGDQVYADEPGPATRQFIAGHRGPGSDADTGAPRREVADFAEYCALYREAWSEPMVRWLFSVIPTAMIFDDHDVHDDWNTSASWRRDSNAKPWWPKRIESAFQAYWVYQHLGNLSPEELAKDETWQRVRESADAALVLADFAHRADQRAPGVRFSFARTFSAPGGKVRVAVLDSRSRRVVDGVPRLMADDAEWQWLTESVSGDWEHVVLATSVPPLLPRGIHALEAWDERISAGAWGRRAAGFGERFRRAIDLEHWPAFEASFTKLEQLLIELATGQRAASGEPPASVTIISGDVHHSYLAAVDLPRQAASSARSRGAVYEAVCSPFHQAMPPKMITAQQLASSKPGGLIGTAVAKLAGVRMPRIKWRVTDGPWFDNMIAVLEYDGPRATVRFDRAFAGAAGPHLEQAMETTLT